MLVYLGCVRSHLNGTAVDLTVVLAVNNGRGSRDSRDNEIDETMSYKYLRDDKVSNDTTTREHNTMIVRQ